MSTERIRRAVLIVALLNLVAVAWPAHRRRKVGGILAALILIPAIAAIVVVVQKLLNPAAPSPEGLTATAAGALVVNVICALILMRLRDEGSSLTTGAWLAARNDALANVLIMLAGLLTFRWPTAWFDIAAGVVIAAVNITACKEVWEASREEHDSVEEAFAELEED